MKLLSLFSGIGAFEKALDRLEIPYELVGFSEIDKYAVKSYCAIHGVDETKNLGDITKIDEKALPKDIDLITYGFPCQDISIAGNQKGLFNEDGSQTRSGLFFDALRIIEETKPRVAIAENVKNLVGKKFNAQFQVVLSSLEAAGYNNYWQVLNAKDYGVPQNRERVFIVSIRKDLDNGTFTFPEGFPLELRLKDLLDDEVDEKYYLSDTAIAGFNKHKARNQAKGNGFGWNPTDGNVVANTLLAALPTRAGDNFVITNCIEAGSLNHYQNDQMNRVYSPDGLSPTILTKTGGGRETKVLVEPAQKDSMVGVQKLFDIPKEVLNDNERQRRVYSVDGASPTLLNRSDSPKIAEDYTIIGGMQKNQAVKTDGVCTTLTSAMGTGGGYVPMHNCTKDLRIRKLTPKECFRLMDFDDEDFIKAEAVNSNTQLYKQAGNSIVVAVPEVIIKALIECGALGVKKENREMELKIYNPTEDGFVKAIEWNHEEIKQEVSAKVEYYKNLVYTDEQIKDAKTDRATLNKFVTALEDKRKEIKKQCLVPYEEFEKKMKEIVAIVQEPINLIDSQVKAYEDKQKQEKLEKINEYMKQVEENLPDEIHIPIDPKWLNASVSMKSVQETINEKAEQIRNDIETLSNLPEFGFEATEVYKTTLDMNKAINEAKRMSEIAKARAEHEARIKAQEEEQARLKAEAMTQPTNPVAQVIESVERQAETVKQWIKFQALLSEEDALALKEFFNSRNIDFKVAV